MNIFKRRIFKLLPWIFALLLLIPLKLVQQRNLDRALLRALSAASPMEEDKDDLRYVEALLRKGARHDAQADLFIGILRGSVAEVRAALDNGANVNARTGDGITTLTHAIQRKHPDVLRVLIERGVNVNAADGDAENYWPPLISAVEVNDADAVRLLLSAGAKVNATTSSGATALDQAPWTNEGDGGTICRLLLKAGAKSFNAPELRRQMLSGTLPRAAPPGSPPPA